MSKRGPWEFISREEKYINPWIKVFEDQVITPSNKPSVYGVVKADPGIYVLPIDQEENVYLIREFKYLLNEERIEVASGGKKDKENFEEAAKRELKEELGIVAKNFFSLGQCDPLTGVIDCPNELFIATGIEVGDQALDENEVIKVMKTSLADAVDMVMKNEIKEATSALLILKTQNLIQQEKIKLG